MAGRAASAAKISARLRWAPVWLIVVIVLAPGWAAGQTPDRRSLHGYRVRHMMPAATMLSVAQTADGYLWFGTLKGLARYDGRDFVFFDESNSKLPDDEIGALLADGNDTLWIGTLNAGLVRKRGADFTAFTPRDGFCGDEVRALTLFQGELWAGTDGGLCRMRGGRWQPEGPSLQRGDAPVADALLAGTDGRLWVGSVDGWSGFDGKTWTSLAGQFVPGEGAGALAAIARDFNSFHAIRDSAGASWLVAGRSLQISAGGTATSWAAVDMVGAFHLTNVFEDHEHNLWATSHAGVAQLSPSPIRVTRGDHARAWRPPFSFAEDAHGTLWISSGTELQREDSGDIRLVGDPDNMPDYSLRALLATDHDGVWIATLKPKLVIWRDGRFSTVEFEPIDGTEHPVALTQSADGSIGMGTSSGRILRVEHVQPGATPRVVERARLPSVARKFRLPIASQEDVPGGIGFLAEDGDGYWVGTQGNGLWRLNAGTGVLIRVAGVDEKTSVTAYLRDPVDGAAWFSSSEGLIHIAGSRVAHVRRNNGLKNDFVLSVIDDGIGGLWLATRRGLFRCGRDDLMAVVRGEASIVKTTGYGIDDGLPSERMIAGLRRRSGQLWFATTAGIGVIDPRSLRETAALPPVVFEQTLFDGQSRDATGHAGEALRVPPGRGSVEIRYTLPTFRFNHRLRFQYRLRGWDDRWVEAGDRRLAQFTNLAPGGYTFEARAHEDGHPRQSPVARLSFELSPRFHQTKWFLALVVAVVLALIYLLQFLRVRQVRLRHAAVLDERNRIARDLHDTVAQVFSAIGFNLGTLRRALQAGKSEVEGHFKEIFRTVSNARIVSRSVIQNLRGEGQPLVTALEELSKVYEGVPIVVSIEGEPCRMDAGTETELLRIAQEAVNNSIQHGDATEITIELAFGPPLELSVRDNGRGFAAPRSGGADAGHFGLLGMQERAQRFGGRLAVHTEPGIGTEVSVVMENKQ